ncbi:hypothetical protein [Luteimonas sp. 3794]|uniref:hypothetical protein n=1 Tax=Luteimonas sp. 3794 TaxID=2817730 RepID=UPI00285E96B1|nr:hypothetical protein [Luteimonas sp. 3794]MDR6993249.1 hypothetical protein [Luteimonas sp. 3794]
MNAEQIHALAQVIAAEQTPTWASWIVWVALIAVASAVGAFAGAYLRKRGENYATKQDFDELKQRLRETTEVAEQVRIDLAHNDWMSREWKLLRRQKAEELLAALNASVQYIDEKSVAIVFDGEESIDPNPGIKVSTLTLLYFPEFNRLASEFVMLAAHISSVLMQHSILIGRARGTIGELAAAKDKADKEAHGLSILLKLIASDLKTCVANEMAAMSGVAIPFPSFSPPMTRLPAALFQVLARNFNVVAAAASSEVGDDNGVRLECPGFLGQGT